MRRKFLFLIVFFIETSLIKAKPVSLNTAKTTAINFYSQRFNIAPVNLSLAYIEISPVGDTLYYAFNVNINKGFVIISAEDAATPIIGYSNEGPFEKPAESSDIGFWMQRYKKEIIAISAANIQATPAITAEWTSYINNTKGKSRMSAHSTSVSPLLKTKWNQFGPYWDFCPVSHGKDTSVVGCVAAAMAQIMKFWNYPPHGIGFHGFNDYTPVNFGELSVNLDTSYFNWDDMPDSAIDPTHQIAKLMYDCGISVDMGYSSNHDTGSNAFTIRSNNKAADTACALNSYQNIFGYSNSIGISYKDDSSSWDSLLENELFNGRPIQYSGKDIGTSEGHSWVCDGYDASTNDFHMNWGWQDTSVNTYFALNLLNPLLEDTFTRNDWAIIQIYPTPAPTSDFIGSPMSGTTGMTVNFTDFSIGTDTNYSWQWSFPGGIPSSSDNRNPSVIYNTEGDYDVIEIVTNQFGSYTRVKHKYISVNYNGLIYPNPTQGIITISFNNMMGTNLLEIYNMLGQKIYSAFLTSATTQVDLRRYSAAYGVYLYKIISNNGSSIASGKFVIN